MSIPPFSWDNTPYQIQSAITPAPPPILKGPSRPAHPHLPSFLCLPGELRNTIYTHALTFIDPLIIADSRLHRHVTDRNNGLIELQGDRARGYSRHETYPDYDYNNHIHVNHNLAQAAHPGLYLFLTCRQVFHESSSIFFSNNTFAFNTFRAEGDGDHDSRGLFYAKGANWLAKLGSHLPLLTKVVIDMASLCPEYCPVGDKFIIDCVFADPRLGTAYIELLPLLRVMWARDWHTNIVFASSNINARQIGFRETTKYDGYYDEISYKALTTTLHSLGRDDLCIKKAIDLICHIGVNRDGQSGAVLFRSTHQPVCLPISYYRNSFKNTHLWRYHPCHKLSLPFILDDDKVVSTQEAPHLFDLPVFLQMYIFRLALKSKDTIIVDLDNDKEVLPGLLYVDRKLYDWGARFYYTANDFILTHHIQKNYLENSDFRLHRWLSNNGFSNMSIKDVAALKGRNVCEIRFVSKSADDISCGLAQLRINTVPLMRYASRLGSGSSSGQVKIHVTSWRTTSDGTEELVEQTSFNSIPLRRAILQALDDIDDPEIDRKNGRFPAVVVDGLGDPCEYFIMWRFCICPQECRNC